MDQVVAYCAENITLDETRKVLGTLSMVVLEQATTLIASQDISGLPEFFDLLARQGADYTLLLRELQGYWTDAVFLLQGLTVPGRSQEECDSLRAVVGNLNTEDLFRLIRLAATLEDEIKWSVSPRTRFEISMLRWVTLDRAVAIQQLLEGMPAEGATPTPQSRPVAKAAPAPAPASKPTPEAAPSITIERPSQQAKPAPAQKAAPTPAVPDPVKTHAAPPKRTAGLELEELTASWEQICDALDKISSAASAFAHNDWDVVSLTGTSLTIRPKHQGKFHFESLKTHAPSLEEAILQVTGAKVKVAAAAAIEASAAPVARTASPATSKPEAANGGAADTGDLFSKVTTQFGGEDVTSKMRKSGE